MSEQAIHQVDVAVSFIGIISWTIMMIILENVPDRRVRWVRLGSFGPVIRAYERLPDAWGPLHVVLVVAGVLWLAAVLFRQLRPWPFVVAAGCLVFLATVSALAPGNPQ